MSAWDSFGEQDLGRHRGIGARRKNKGGKRRWCWLAPGKKRWNESSQIPVTRVLTSSHPAVFSKCLCKENFSSYRNNCIYRIPKYFPWNKPSWNPHQSWPRLPTKGPGPEMSWFLCPHVALWSSPTDLCKQEVYPMLTVIGFWAPVPQYPSAQPQQAPATLQRPLLRGQPSHDGRGRGRNNS